MQQKYFCCLPTEEFMQHICSNGSSCQEITNDSEQAKLSDLADLKEASSALYFFSILCFVYPALFLGLKVSESMHNVLHMHKMINILIPAM